MSNIFKSGSDKKTSAFLRDLGIDGIVYNSGTFIKSPFESRAKKFVIFSDKNIKINNKETF